VQVEGRRRREGDVRNAFILWTSRIRMSIKRLGIAIGSCKSCTDSNDTSGTTISNFLNRILESVQESTIKYNYKTLYS
jgi:hypothetical protein